MAVVIPRDLGQPLLRPHSHPCAQRQTDYFFQEGQGMLWGNGHGSHCQGFAVRIVPAAPSPQEGQQREKVYPADLLGGQTLLTLWFQHYFRKKRSLQRNILKKYEPITPYLSVSILILSVEGISDDSMSSQIVPIMNPQLNHSCSHNAWFNQLMCLWGHFVLFACFYLIIVFWCCGYFSLSWTGYQKV